MNKTIVLYSGGLDSTVVLAQAIHRGDDVLALSIDYQQSNSKELEVCQQLAALWGFPHRIIPVHLERTDARSEIPARNTVFLAKALEWALLTNANVVTYGAEPDATYTDSSPAYIGAMAAVFELHGVELQAPIRNLKGKAEVLAMALDLGVPLDLVHSSRTNHLNGACSASKRFLKTVHSFFPAANPIDLITMLRHAHLLSDENPYCISTNQTDSFKFFPALLYLASLPLFTGEVAKICTTGNWGRSFRYVNNLLHRFEQVEIHKTSKVEDLKQNKHNTDAPVAQWGMKQALSRLPRPQYLKHPLSYRRTQDHLHRAVTELGYIYEPAGLPLITETSL